MPEAPDHIARDRRWAFLVALCAMAATMLPFLFGLSLLGARPALGWFSWLGYNLDDSCVYLAWMRQAADGRFFQRNLFTSAPQIGHQFNLFFLVLGWAAGLLHAPLLLVYHAARIAAGMAFLHAAWWLIGMLVADRTARRWAFLLLCSSAGLGWLPFLWKKAVDSWQPEAITFLCLYQSPLFLVSLLLMVGALGFLWRAEATGDRRSVALAGLCGFLLGNIHGYDVITVIVVWGAFLLARSAVERRVDAAAWGRAVVAGALTAVSAGYMFWLVRHEDVFARRAAVPTMSPDPVYYLYGYGLLVPLAIGGLALAWRARDAADRASANAPLFLGVWAAANVAVAYLPVAFQRKMLMGAHLPIAMLAGVGMAHLLSRTRGPVRLAAAAAAIVLLGWTNVRFMLQDAANFAANRGQSGIHRPFLYAGEVGALDWLRAHATPGAVVQPLPWIAATDDGRVAFYDTTVACFAPGLTGHPVAAGHWGETPDFGAAMGQWAHFLLPATQDAWRIELLRRTGVRYVVFTQKHDEDGPASGSALTKAWREAPPAMLRAIPEASGPDAEVYEVMLPR